ncbi:MAG: MFS transporter, partial [Acidobacteria bacterium]|nr:MFS transporter [Acidobacteriota bacterium]
FYAAALVLVLVVYKDPPIKRAASTHRGGWEVFAHLMRLPGFVLALFVIFGLQTVDRSFGPVLPLFVAQVGVEPQRIPIVSGILFSLGAVSAACGSQLAARLLKHRSAKRVIVSGTATAAVALAAIVVAPTLWLVGASMVAVGLAIGVATTTIYSVAGSLLPADAHATGFGVMTTASLIGLAVSPVVAGLIGGSGLRIVFVADVALLVVLAVLVARRLRSEPTSVSNEAPLADS